MVTIIGPISPRAAVARQRILLLSYDRIDSQGLYVAAGLEIWSNLSLRQIIFYITGIIQEIHITLNGNYQEIIQT
ncbi:hypothetical protein [Bifidobacterium kimbladii]|uniref:hypothetical protein n=1 Tax=Bifidobacterium kimbladii TaxID=1293826 RepID=UPI001E6169A3|nr:hypothetical protein [Bifidobacterium asteroides]